MIDQANSPLIVEPDRLGRFARSILIALGTPDALSGVVADHLVGAHLAGHDSHGVQLLPYYADLVAREKLHPAVAATVVVDTGSLVVIDGHDGWGQVTARVASDLAAERALAHGVAVVFGRRASHIGRIGEYTSALAERGLYAIMFAGSGGGAQIVAPFGGSDRRLSNNPLSLAAPSERGPVLADLALSTVAEGKLAMARDRGEPIPAGWIARSDGAPSTDPADYFAGGHLLPIAGHKGASLIVMSEILAGVLGGGGGVRTPEAFESNTFALIAIDIRPLRESDEYEEEVAAMREHVVGAPRLPGFDRIYFPGDVELEAAAARAGGIPIPDGTRRRLDALADSLGVAELS
jgi:hydroxycarboxylate dehydrogenase B